MQHAARFSQNERIVLCHVSRKYKRWDNVLSLVREALASTPSLAARTGVTLAGFGRGLGEPVTWLSDEAAEQQQPQPPQQEGAVGADGGLEADVPEMEVRSKEEVGHLLRVMSEDMGLRPRAESLVGEIEVEDGGKTVKQQQQQQHQQEEEAGAAGAAAAEEEPTLLF